MIPIAEFPNALPKAHEAHEKHPNFANAVDP
jgi:hypothetical protein